MGLGGRGGGGLVSSLLRIDCWVVGRGLVARACGLWLSGIVVERNHRCWVGCVGGSGFEHGRCLGLIRIGAARFWFGGAWLSVGDQ